MFLYFIPFLLYLFATIKALCTFLISTLLFSAFLSIFYQHLIIFFKVAQGGMFPRSIKKFSYAIPVFERTFRVQ
jgi:hypothetical protein